MTVALKALLEGASDPGTTAPTFIRCDETMTVESVTADSRAVQPGVAFMALAGATHDGHDFIDAAVAAGAPVVLLERNRPIPRRVPCVVLDSTADAHGPVAANLHGNPARHLELGAITGTNGKTTATHFAASTLAAAGRRHGRLGTTGNWLVDRDAPAPFTTPFPFELQGLLATIRARGGTHAVMEASSHALVQGRLEPVRFSAVGLTSFSQDHLDFHPTMAAYLEAKCLLPARHLVPDGVAIAAVDDQAAATTFLDAATAAGAQAWKASRGADPTAEILALDHKVTREGSSASVRTPRGQLQLRMKSIADYDLDNALVAVGIALGLGIELSAIAEGLARAEAPPGRLERVRVPGAAGPTVYVDYAHTPDAVARVLKAVRRVCEGRLVVLLGCGGDRDRDKRAEMGAVAAACADVFFATSDNPRTEDPDAIVDDMTAGVAAEHTGRVVREVDRASAIGLAIGQADPSDLILIAGKGHEDYQVLGTEKIHFDDREHAADALRARSR